RGRAPTSAGSRWSRPRTRRSCPGRRRSTATAPTSSPSPAATPLTRYLGLGGHHMNYDPNNLPPFPSHPSYHPPPQPPASAVLGGHHMTSPPNTLPPFPSHLATHPPPQPAQKSGPLLWVLLGL